MMEPGTEREPTAGPPGADLDKSGRAIRDMFAGVAPRYDLLNHVLSGALDVVWRRKAARRLTADERGRVLDLCCGTGDQALSLAKRGATVTAADFCVPMLALADRKFDRESRFRNGGPPRPTLAAADALSLPFPTGRFTAATVSFGLRNVADLDRALVELARVLAPGGRLLVLEFAVPEPRLLRSLYLFYFRHVLPRLGSLLSPRGTAYSYLPESVMGFPQRRGFTECMERAGMVDCTWEDVSAGIVCLYSGRIPT